MKAGWEHTRNGRAQGEPQMKHWAKSTEVVLHRWDGRAPAGRQRRLPWRAGAHAGSGKGGGMSEIPLDARNSGSSGKEGQFKGT